MNYLLDTHTFLWLVDSPEDLPSQVLGIIQNRVSTIWVSLIVPWEIAIKSKIGKLDAADLLDDFEEKATRAKLSILSTTVGHVIRAGGLPLHHRDPFDRLLIAQSLELRFPILGSDGAFDPYGVHRIWD